MINVLTLGVTLAQGPVRPLPPGRPLAALIFLALRKQKVSREELAHLLWDAGSVRSERHSLSQLLYSIKQVLPPDALTVDSYYVKLEPTIVNVDYNEFFYAFTAKNYVAATSLYRGAFLSGFPIISEAFDEWRSERAAAAESTAIEAYRVLVEQGIAAEDIGTIPELCTRALQIARHDPFFIRVHIEALAAQNEIGAALAAYGLHRRLLIRETGSIPRWMTDDFVSRISVLSQLDTVVDSAETSVPFVGRAELLQTIRKTWQQTERQSQVVSLVGEAGVGKSRLVNQFLRRAALDGARVHLHKCAEAEALVPYAAIAGLLLSNYRTDILSGLNSQLRSALASVAPEITVEDHVEQYQQRVVFEAFAQYFAAVAGTQRVLLALDDYQWSDDASRAALNHVIRRLDQSACLILLASRPQANSSDGDEPFAKLVVERMQVHEVNQLIQHHERLFARTFDQHAIYERTGGNPFFVVQLLRYLTENPEAKSGPGSDTPLPVSISRVLRSRLSRLSDAARRTAAAAAVLNRPASVSALAEVSGLSAIDAANGIDELVRLAIVQDGQNCQFVHDLMRQTAYQETSVALLQVLHDRAARTLMPGGTSQGELAYHFEQAGLADDAWTHARAAAQEAIRVSAYREADAQYQRMLRCSGSDRSAQTHAEYLKFLYDVDRLVDASTYVDAAELYAGQCADRELRLICAVVRYVADGAPTLHGARQLTEEAQRSCPDQLPKVIQCVFRGSGVAADILKPLGRMLQEETTGTAGAHRQATAATILGMTEGYEVALPVIERAVVLAEQSQDALALISALFARGGLRTWAGMCIGALADYERVVSLNEEVGSVELHLAANSNISVVYLEQGNLRAAEACAQRALGPGMPAGRAYAAGNLALLHYRRGDYHTTRRYVEILENSPTRDFQKWIPLQALVLKGLCSVGEQDWMSAIQIERELADFADVQAIPDRSTIHRFVGHMIAFREGPERAEAYLLKESERAMKFDYLAGARIALLATSYFKPTEGARGEAIASGILERTSKYGAFAVAEEASRVIESLQSYRSHRSA